VEEWEALTGREFRRFGSRDRRRPTDSTNARVPPDREPDDPAEGQVTTFQEWRADIQLLFRDVLAAHDLDKKVDPSILQYLQDGILGKHPETVNPQSGLEAILITKQDGTKEANLRHIELRQQTVSEKSDYVQNVTSDLRNNDFDLNNFSSESRAENHLPPGPAVVRNEVAGFAKHLESILHDSSSKVPEPTRAMGRSSAATGLRPSRAPPRRFSFRVVSAGLIVTMA
jgi:hypothetical protein